MNNMQGKNKFNSVGKQIFGILLLQICPGSEKEICKQLFDSFKGNISIYYACAEFDLVALVKLKEDDYPEDLTQFFHPKIKDYQQFICVSWDTGNKTFEFENILLLSLLKFEENSICTEGLYLEQTFINSLHRELSNKKGTYHLILSNFGWPELVVLQSNNDISDLLKSMNSLPLSNSEFANNVCLCHTITCLKINESLLENDSFGINIENIANKKSLQKNINWRILISCMPGKILPIKNDLEKNFSNFIEVNIIYGRRDLIITPKENLFLQENTIKVLINILFHTRSNLATKNYIFGTHSQIYSTIEPIRNRKLQFDTHEFSNNTNSLEKEFEKVVKQVEKFSDWENTVGNKILSLSGQLQQIVNRLQAINATPGIENIAKDMFPFAKNIIQLTTKITDDSNGVNHYYPNRKEFFNEIEPMLQVFFFGLEQRMVGAMFGIGNPSQAYSNLYGLGIQRILQASAAIPASLMELFNKNGKKPLWDYFTIFGFNNETYTYHSGIINLPYIYFSTPENWWQLGHECGHAFCEKADLLDNPIISAYVENINKDEIENITGQDIDKIINEFVACIFEYKFCFGGNFDIYVKLLWDYFNDYLKKESSPESIKNYILRTVFVYFYDLFEKGNIKPNEKVEDLIEQGKGLNTLFREDTRTSIIQRVFGEENSLENIIKNTIIKKIQDIAKDIHYQLDFADAKEIEKSFVLLEDLRDVIHLLFSKYKIEKISLTNKNLEKKLKNFRNKLNNGQLIIDIANPHDVYLIILALKYKSVTENELITNRAKYTAILSLWHWERINRYSHKNN